MELLRLEIHNIASIEDAVIDFSSAPLRDEPLFLICGETGSGKSTILDAICLALYNDTPRLASSAPERIEDRIYGDSAGRGSGGKDEISTDDPRQFLRRGTGEGHVRLEFTGADDVEYTALWSVSRVRGRSDGRLKRAEWSLSSPDWTLNLQKDIHKRIEQIIGLNFSQFCRTTMLAQGEFSRFLKSTEAEKADILEKLTRTDIYSRIGAGIFARAKEKKEAYLQQKARTEGIVLLDDAQKEAIGREIETKSAMLVSVKAGYSESSMQLDRYQKAGRLENDLRQCSEEKILKYIEYKTLRHASEEFEKNIGIIETEAESLNERLSEEAAYEKMYASCQTIVLELGAVIDSRRTILDNESKIKAANQSIASHAASRDRMKEELSKLVAEKTAIQTSLDRLRTSIAEMDKPGKTASKTEVVERRSALSSAGYALQAMLDKDSSIESLRARLDADRKALAQYKSDLSDAEKKNMDAVDAYEKASSLYDSLKDSVENWAKVARSKLHEGDICPLCGGRVKKIVSDSDFEQMLSPVIVKLQKCKEQKDSAAKEFNRLSAVIDTTEKNIEARTADLDILVKEYSFLANDAMEKCRICGLDIGSKDIKAEIRSAFDAAKADIDRLDAELQNIGDFEKRADGMQAKADSLQKNISDTETSLNAESSVIAGYESETKRLESLSEMSRTRISEALRDVGSVMCVDGWQDRFDADPERFIDEIKERAAKYESDRNRYTAILSDISRKNDIRKSIQVSRQAVESLYKDWDRMYNDGYGEELHKGRDVPGSDIGLQTAWSGLLAEGKALIQKTLSVETELEGLRDEIRKACENSGQAYGDRSGIETLVREYGARIDELNKEIGACQQQLKQDRDNAERAGLEKSKEESLKSEFVRWDKLADIFGDLKGVKFKKIAQGYVLKELLTLANSYLSHFSDRYMLDCQGGSLSITVHDMYQGGTERSVNTLSGGETFLVSLSLALGLSSLDGRGMNVSILFIDEGFGTLSDDFLNVVMNTLENLHQIGGKKVGIISHVEALKERIPTQIQVKRQGGSSSTVEVVSW